MAKKDSLVRFAMIVALLTGARLGAQVVERPVPFDSAGSVRVVTPLLEARLGLAAPLWPVSGSYVGARLFAVSTGGAVLVAERPDGSLERHPLTDEQVRTLRARIGIAVASVGTRVGEDRADVISEPARGAFLRNQMILSALLYGPLLASLTDDAKTGTALYLLTAGGSYFALNAISRSTPVTRAQNDLATDGALRGAGTALGLLHTFGPDEIHDDTYRSVALGGAIAGSALGFARGRGLTDSEAHAAMKASTFGAAMALGVTGAAGLMDDQRNERVVAGAALAGGVTGYLLGPAYPRRARYTVTAGDVRLLPIAWGLGALAGATPFMDNDDEKLPLAGATVGGLAGMVLGDRGFVRPFDHSSGDVTQVWLGTLAGGLLGGATIVLTDTDHPGVISGMLTAGGLLGAIAGQRLANPQRAGLRTSGLPERDARESRVDVQFNPMGVLSGAARVPGVHSALTLRF